jgi:hypothetical protein
MRDFIANGGGTAQHSSFEYEIDMRPQAKLSIDFYGSDI